MPAWCPWRRDHLWATLLQARAIERVWDFAARICRQRFPPGVYRHRSNASAQRRREEWAQENSRAFQERRRNR